MQDIVREYSGALYELAAEQDLCRQISDDLNLISRELSAEPEYVEFLRSPAIALDERLGALEAAFGGRVHEYTLSFLSILTKNGHPARFNECAAEYNDMYLAGQNALEAHIISAVPLTEGERDALHKKLCARTGRSVTLDCSVDKSILGGVIVEIGGMRIDGSVQHTLQSIKDVMNQ